MIEAGKVSVVLVDDSVDVRTLVRMRLESSGLFDVKGEAADGEQAIALVIRDEPTLVLLDVSMPSMDGLETLPSILAVRPETAVVMFSGFGGTHLAAEVRELGAIDFIEKSIPLEQLAERLLQSLQVTSPEPVTPPPPPSTSPTDAPAELLGADADATRLEQEILDEHLEGFRALFDRAAIGMATMTVHATIVRANDALADLMSCEPRELVGRRLRPPDRWAGRRPGPPPRGTADLAGERRHVRAPHPRTAGSDGRPHRPRDARPDPRLGRPDALRVRAGAGHQRPAHRRGRAAPHRGEVPVPGRRGRGVRRVHARHPRTGDELERRGAADQGLRADEIIGSDFRVFYPEEQQLTGHPQRNLEAALRDGSFAEEGWRVRQDGTRFWASVVISPVHDDRGLHIGFAKVTRDQTEQRQNADDRVEAMAEQARLLAVTAHELRNPTAVIDGSAHALQVSEGQMSAGERDQLFRGIRSSAERLRRLAADLTAASQLQGSGMEFRRQSVSLPELVRGAAARREAASPTAHVGVDVPDGAVLQADEVRLAQAIDNLLDNAIRHGAPPFTMGAQVRGDHVELRVTDAGHGVPDELVSRLFDRFAAAGATSGTGLGLYLVREIARGHGGEVVYQPPADDSPTTFLIRVPVAAASA